MLRLKSAVNIVWKSKKAQKNPLTIGIILLSLIVGFYLYHRPITEPQQSIKVVETAVITPTYIRKTIDLIGVIRPKHTTLLTARASGLLEPILLSGQTVKKGDLIARIINPEIEKSHQLSKATEGIAKNQYKRFLHLKEKGFVSTRELEEKKQKWIEAQKELAKTKIELKNLRFYSPFDGIIGAFKIRESAQVNDGEVLVTVYDPLNVSIDLDIPCSHLKHIKENQPVYVNHHRHPLSHLQRMMDDETHMCPADVDIPCDHCVIGDSITVQLLITEKKDALIIPTQALFLKNEKLSVYKVINNRIKLVTVKSGIQEKDKVEIISGLNPEDQVIIKGPERLYPGMEVSVYQPSKNDMPG
jgi:membrane fusion protein (multidrug efflux system)